MVPGLNYQDVLVNMDGAITACRIAPSGENRVLAVLSARMAVHSADRHGHKPSNICFTDASLVSALPCGSTAAEAAQADSNDVLRTRIFQGKKNGVSEATAARAAAAAINGNNRMVERNQLRLQTCNLSRLMQKRMSGPPGDGVEIQGR